ncbi:3-hydroxyacyl-CoA dehydrogenase NAD-binding domain-containing protein [Accumulibacter sp.]|uniref:3-hydroxyacyl-CoA dehydrogenase NAD-binding domain-containing protein n=1 Tax=Accumulibacter sp. TaxID=2053492 RepID=UPI00261EECEA|nr:3-hydroxyacyl-CoA dehydrogenase NAD-binding domain-containing protein [Accumulibacter sp.]
MSSAVVKYSREGPVALLTVDNPPVNALSREVRAGLLAALARAEDDDEVVATLIVCAGRTFIAGADVSEFERPPQEPHLPELTLAIENASKPVVSALHGTALGGGFEIALASHYRIALPATKVGLPEVRLGVIPGAGGTQRLPRLIGLPEALRLIRTGESITAEQALSMGAIDEIVPTGLTAAAVDAAIRLAGPGSVLRRTGLLPVASTDPAVFDEALRQASTQQRHLEAPLAVIEALRAAATMPLGPGLRRERELFLERRASPQAAALRNAFLGEREVARVPGLAPGTPTRPIHQVAVLGAGTMGGGIAMCFANAGFDVNLFEADAQALERGVATIRKNYESSVARGGLAADEMRSRLSRIRPTLQWPDLANADLVVEAVFEDREVKRQVFEKLDAIAKKGAILASNTSYLDVAEIAEFTRRPEDVVGMHFFSPANVMRLLENVRTGKTADDVIATVMKLGKTLGKVAVLVGGCDGFVGNRMLAQRTREAWFLLEEGALPQQVDAALVNFGFPMGPFAVSDLAGLDIGWRNRKSRAHLRKAGVRDCDLLDQVCELGRLGQKTGAGWYRYAPGSRAPLPDPAIEELITAHSRARGIARRVISEQEIVERCVYSMINEGAKILAEGVAARPIDVDMVWLHGYGFPAWRGGPLYYADQIGLAKVLDTIRQYADHFGADFWAPAPRLCELVASGKTFY